MRPENETPLESILRLAIEKGANPDQIAILETAVASNGIAYSDVREAVDRTYACFEDAGLDYIEDAPDPAVPFERIKFSVEVGTEAKEALADACVFGNSYFIQAAYENQPDAVAATDAHFDRLRPLLIGCLNDAGYPASEDLTNDELKKLLIYSETGIDVGSDALPPDNWDSPDCVGKAGLDGF